MRTRIKICGLTTLEDALAATSLGADAVGFIFAEESPRKINPEDASMILSQIPPLVTRVGVFKDQDPEWIREVVSVCQLHLVQLHGNESPEYCKKLGLNFIKAFRIKDEESLLTIQPYRIPGERGAFLLDTFHPEKPGGTGVTFDWNLAQQASQYGLITLSGGLTPENISDAIRQVHPYAVDTSSGVEISFGKKDIKKIASFIERVHQTDQIIYGNSWP